MKLTRAEAVVLTQANEDWSQLFEIVWALRTLTPGVSDSALLHEAKSALKSLLHKGLIQMAYANPSLRTERVLDREQALRLIDKADSWKPTEDEEFLSFIPTKAGKRWWTT